MGVVYKARHRKLNRLTAIKMILGGRFSSSDEMQRFHMEAEAAARLDHPSIVPVYEIGEQDGQPFFAMKYIDGGSLADQMERLQADPRLAAQMLSTVARAVHHAHQRGILHRDLKPANVLIDDGDQPLITDLGLAKSTAGDSQLTKTGAVLGTPAYMSPEQATGEQAVTTATDIYALGAILYELLTGRPPHTGATAIETVMSVRNDTPVSPRKRNLAIDVDLELICLKCLERDPEQRYGSAAALAGDLDNWLSGAPISVAPPSMAAVAARWVRHNRRLVYAGFALLLGMAFTIPLLAGFFNNVVFDVRRHFPKAERPWFFALEGLPDWVAGASFLVLALLVWPSIGLWNAIVTRPVTTSRAMLFGVLTSTLCSGLVAAAFGWAVVLIVAGNYAGDRIVALGEAVWTPPDTSPDEARRAAVELYDGLDNVAVEQRARVLSDRIFYEQVARVPWAFAIIGIASVLLALPILWGTVIATMLLDRKLSFWLLAVRYAAAWISATVLAVMVIGYVFGIVTGSLSTRYTTIHAVLTVVCLTTFYLAIKRWMQPIATESALSGAERPTPTPIPS